MKFYRFSPIQNTQQLLEAINFTHFACYQLCQQSFGKLLPNSGNMGIFCHFDDEFELLIKIREELTESSDNWNQKYFRLLEPIVIPAKGEVPVTTYTHLYIRKPDPYRHHVGDVDFFLDPEEYIKTKKRLMDGEIIKGARVFSSSNLDMIELFDPNIDALSYISTHKMTEIVRAKHS